MALWGGRFESGPDPLFRELNDSLGFDRALAREDIEGSRAWARAIHRAGVLSESELRDLEQALAELLAVVDADPALPTRESAGRDEDIHSWVERQLIEKVGQLGKKLHTGRSRNDQVATDLRLWTRRAIDARLEELASLRGVLIEFARAHQHMVLPGYTHLQRAQPVTVAHWALAYEAMCARDSARLRDARSRVNVCPLGSGALAGTAYPVDRDALARDLGFLRTSENSIDAVSDRDFVIETLAALATIGVHMSRLGEDLIIYSTGEFAFITFDDAFSSGSSLMPQKKNPDAAELMRGKAGRLVGGLVSLLVTVKGLPTAYNKDLQEDKEPLFDAMRHASLSLRAAGRSLRGLTVHESHARDAARLGYSNATDLADYLVVKGVAFRDAHEQVGRVVRRAIELNVALDDMPLDELQKIAPACGADVFGSLTIEAGMKRRSVLGATGATEQGLAFAEKRLREEASGG